MRGKSRARLRWLRSDVIVTLDNFHVRFPFERDIHVKWTMLKWIECCQLLMRTFFFIKKDIARIKSAVSSKSLASN